MSSRRKDYLFEPFKVTRVRCQSADVPRPRSGHRIACDDNNIYCFGGYNPTPSLPHSSTVDYPTWTPMRPLFRELWSFNIATRKWKQLRVVENMPDELASNAMCMIGQHLLIYGGTGAPFGNKCNNDVIAWNTKCTGDAKLYVLEVGGQRPPGQYGQAILCHEGYFYTIGGTNGFAYNSDIYRLDLRTRVWEPIFVATGGEGEPLGRYRHEVARVDDDLYILGGGTGEWAFELMEIPKFNLKTRSWSILAPKADAGTSVGAMLQPQPRKCHSAVQIETPDGVQVFVAGGSDGDMVFDDVWRLTVHDMQWTLMQRTHLPKPLYFHSSAVTSYGCMYLFGGIEPRDTVARRNNIMFKVWITIPKLSEMCWEALLYFHPNLDQIDRSQLLNIGIPKHCVARLHPE